MTIYNFTSSVLNSVRLFFPEIQDKEIIDCVHCEYNSSNLFVMKLKFYMWNFQLSGFSEKLSKFSAFLNLQNINTLDEFIAPHIVNDDEEDEDIIESKDCILKKTNYRDYYFLVPMNIAKDLEE